MTGQTSPCEGVLLSRLDVVRLADESLRLKRAEIEKAELAAKLEQADKLLQLDRERCDARVDACDAQVKVLQDRLTGHTPEVEDTPLLERPWFVATITLLVSAAIIIPVTWLAVTEAR
jgi:hypothetical protein